MSLLFSKDGQSVLITCGNPVCPAKVTLPRGSALLHPLPAEWVTVVESVNVLITGQGKTWLVCSAACAATLKANKAVC
jgi:hypothetical protein